MPLPAADKAEPQDVQKYKATALGFAVVKGGMKAGEESFGFTNFGEDGLSLGSNKVGSAHCNPAHVEAIVGESVGHVSNVKREVAVAINDGFWLVDVEVVTLQCVGVIGDDSG